MFRSYFVLFVIVCLSLCGCSQTKRLYSQLTKKVEVISCEKTVVNFPGPVGQKRKIRALVLGDFGTGKKPQKMVAEAMVRIHKKSPFDFAIGLGDNFYPDGVSSVRSPRFRRDFEEIYQEIEIPFFLTLGNHDHYGNPRAQIEYKSKRWQMPCAYYGLKSEKFRVFFLDTPQFIDEKDTIESQLKQMRDFLCDSKGVKILAGHHPLVSREAKDRTREQKMFRRLALEAIKSCEIDFYLAGHSHLLAYDIFEDVEQFISGAAAKSQSCLKSQKEDFPFCYGDYGFAVLEISEGKTAKIIFYDINGKMLYQKKSLLSASRK